MIDELLAQPADMEPGVRGRLRLPAGRAETSSVPHSASARMARPYQGIGSNTEPRAAVGRSQDVPRVLAAHSG
tara:strand:+ start:610 stop:828 length:219 start_codon:yes stop_codon:yes gene_type:complete